MFWDSSALVPLFLEQPGAEAVRRLPEEPRAVWWTARVECASAYCRLAREGLFDAPRLEALLDHLDALLSRAVEVQPAEAVRDRAERLLRVHGLRAGDSLQLSAALAYCEERPRGVGFVCLDERLRQAARAEGFTLLPV